MKKILLLCAVALLAVACGKEDNLAPSNNSDNNDKPQNNIKLVEKTFETSALSSKTAIYDIQNSGLSLGFHSNDTIQVFDPTNTSASYVIRPTGVNMQEGGEVNGAMIYKKMNFRGNVPESASMLGFLYPYKNSYSFSSTTVSNVVIPTTQYIPAGTYDPSAIFFYAYTSDVQITMQNPCALVMISFGEDCNEYDQLMIVRDCSVGGSSKFDLRTGTFSDAPTSQLKIYPSEGDYFSLGSSYFVVLEPGKGSLEVKRYDKEKTQWIQLIPEAYKNASTAEEALAMLSFYGKQYTLSAGKCYHIKIHANNVYELVPGLD